MDVWRFESGKTSSNVTFGRDCSIPRQGKVCAGNEVDEYIDIQA